MARIVVAYASKDGQTRKIAEGVAEHIRERGNDAVVVDAARTQTLDHVDAVIVAAPVRYGKHLAPAEDFVRKNRSILAAVPSGFLSVSMTVTYDPAAAAKTTAEFMARTAWKPTLVEDVGGALRYRDYGFLTRMLVLAIAKSHGEPTDTSRNHELTDWAKLDRFVDRFLSKLPREAEALVEHHPAP